MSLNIFRELLLSSLSSVFSKVTSSTNYKVMTAIASSVDDAQTQIDNMSEASSINQATSADLDLHGYTLDVQRIIGENDATYRQRILASYDRPYVTKPNLKELTQQYSESDIRVEEYILDRWWLGGNPWPQPVTEYLPALTDTVTQTSSGILTRTMPEGWLAADTARTGTNYTSGSTWTNNASGAELTLTTPVSAGTILRITYTPNTSPSGDDIDWVPHGYLGDDTIIHHRLVSNNYGEIESIPSEISIQTNMLPGYQVYSMYNDIETGIVYSWISVVDGNKRITLKEENRTDNLVSDEFQNATSTTQVQVNHDIAKVIGVWLATDPDHEGINYATDNTFDGRTIYLNTELPSKTGLIVNYHRYSITDYQRLDFEKFVKTGEDDLRFTLELQMSSSFIKWGTFKYRQKRWGELINEVAGTVGELLNIAKAAGVKTKAILITAGAIYGRPESIYAQVYYGGSYY